LALLENIDLATKARGKDLGSNEEAVVARRTSIIVYNCDQYDEQIL
jgi:hypothetical protein